MSDEAEGEPDFPPHSYFAWAVLWIAFACIVFAVSYYRFHNYGTPTANDLGYCNSSGMIRLIQSKPLSNGDVVMKIDEIDDVRQTHRDKNHLTCEGLGIFEGGVMTTIVWTVDDSSGETRIKITARIDQTPGL